MNNGAIRDRVIPDDPRSSNAARRFGYRLLPGDGFSYLLHMRPREWPIVAAHALFGFLLALPGNPNVADRWVQAGVGVAVFVIFLNAGTLAINSAFDRDQGDIGYLDAPPPPPRHLFAFGMGLMLFGLVISLLLLPRPFSVLYGVCVVMSVLYSVPPFRWKAVAGLDVAINAIGIGTLTALAGWTLADLPVSPWAWIVLIGFAPLFAALYPLTQLYQFEEDRRRGDRTLALALGMKRALLFAVAMTLLAFNLLFAGLSLRPDATWTLIVVIPAVAWLLVLAPWLARYRSMSEAQHKRGMYRALQAWAVTDVAVAAAVLIPAFT